MDQSPQPTQQPLLSCSVVDLGIEDSVHLERHQLDKYTMKPLRWLKFQDRFGLRGPSILNTVLTWILNFKLIKKIKILTAVDCQVSNRSLHRTVPWITSIHFDIIPVASSIVDDRFEDFPIYSD